MNDDATSDLLGNFQKNYFKKLEISNFFGMAKLERPKLTSKPVGSFAIRLNFNGYQ